jgi:metal-responsive CopG/Arc/MetJ family transcriptional regulator
MMEEIDRIVRELPELNYNRQQFVETAIREKIEKFRTMNAKKR